jgi:ATP-dependent helicase/DNAse subunit B
VALDDPELRERLRVKHRKLSPSAIDSYLQCPFQFFVRQTLGLAARPVRPEERLDVLTQGSIMHRALEFADQPLRMESEFHAAFERFCEELNVPDTYRREAIRREMLRNLSACAAIRGLGWKAETEVRFEFDLNDSLSIKGRIDRLESSSRGEALVIDFKYSAPSAVKSRAGSDATVQTGLYLIAAERALKKKPFGMLYCGVKSGITWVGCHLEDPDLREINETVTPDELRRRMEIAAETAARAQQTILLGRILPQPADVAKCAWCEARDICRVSAAAPEQVGVADAAPDGGEIE